MQMLCKNPRHVEISIERSLEMDARMNNRTIIDPASGYLPLDDCDFDFY